MIDVTFWSAALGGLVVFFSPCVLPIVPFYLSYMAGVGMAEIRADGALAPGVRRRAVAAAVMFSLGIITVFVLLGAAAFSLSQAFRAVQDEFRLVAAGLVALMGLHFLGVLRLPLLNRSYQIQGGETRDMSIWGAYVVGLAFAAGWTPCVGGVLFGVMFTASQEATALRGLGLMVVFGVAMTAPFVVAALFIRPFLRFAARFRPWLPLVERTMGALMLLFAVLIATGAVARLAQALVPLFEGAPS